MSTKAPKLATLVTTPSSIMPGLQVLELLDAVGKVAVLNSGRGSRPGFSSSLRMSLHGRQAEAFVGVFRSGSALCARKLALADQFSRRPS
jgi:hypothetical protein